MTHDNPTKRALRREIHVDTSSAPERERIAKMLEESRQRVKPIVKQEREAERVTPAVANLRLK